MAWGSGFLTKAVGLGAVERYERNRAAGIPRDWPFDRPLPRELLDRYPHGRGRRLPPGISPEMCRLSPHGPYPRGNRWTHNGRPNVKPETCDHGHPLAHHADRMLAPYPAVAYEVPYQYLDPRSMDPRSMDPRMMDPRMHAYGPRRGRHGGRHGHRPRHGRHFDDLYDDDEFDDEVMDLQSSMDYLDDDMFSDGGRSWDRYPPPG